MYTDPWIGFSSQGGSQPPPGYESQIQVLASPLTEGPLQKIESIGYLLVAALGIYLAIQLTKKF